MTTTVPPRKTVSLTVDQALQQAITHQKAGQFQDAERYYRAILQAQPNHPDANHNLGVLARQMGNHAAGLPYLKAALAIKPSQGQYALSYADALLATGQAGEALNILQSAMQRGLNTAAALSLRKKAEAAVLNDDARGEIPAPVEMGQLVALFNAGRFVELESRTHVLVEQHPDFGFAWKLLGTCLQVQGKESLPALHKAAELLPADADVHNNLGLALQGLGRLDDAVASYRRALEIETDFVEAHANLGNALRELGQLDGAIASYRRALEIKPDFAEVHFNLGNILRDLGQLDGAMASYRRALEIKPDFAEAHSILGAALHDLGQLDGAVASCRRALEIKPDLAEAHSILGTVLKSIGNLREARACYRKAKELGSNGAWVREALMLPAIMGTRQEMMESRAEFERNLDQLMARAVPHKDPLGDIGETNFYLAYHGLNDRDLQVKLAKYYEQACPSLLYIAPHCIGPRSDAQKKIRVGFLSRFLYNHSVSLCFSKIVETLSLKDRFEVTLISDRPIDETIYSEFAGNRVRVPNNLVRARELLAALELDILVYLDIGMDPLTYFLAFSRLARVQCVLGGHPVTTGIGNMDYFLSTGLLEPPGADDHYSEQLIRLPRPLFYFARPVLPATLKTRRELGLPEGRHIYMCPMRLQKMHPDFDEAITRILQLDGNGAVVLFEDILLPFGKRLLVERFEKTIPADVRQRIIFLPWLTDPNDLTSAIANADVVLDPFHFGIGSTAIMVFATGTPLVTKAGEFMRGRVGMGYCRMLDLPEWIAEDTEAYARKAVRIASDRSLRDTISAKILKNNHVLYENLQPVDDLEAFFCSLSDRLAKQP